MVFSEMKEKSGTSWKGATEYQVINRCRNARAALNGSDVYRTIESPEIAKFRNSNLWFLQFNISLPVKNDEKLDRIIRMGNPSLFSLLSGNNELFIDGTFKIVPKPFYQVLVIMCYDQQTRKYVPIMYILMTGKTEVLYRHALYWVNAIVFGHSTPKMVTCDFEKGLINAVRGTFKNVTVNGCLFHWKQAILRKLKELRFENKHIPYQMVHRSVLDVLTVISKAEVPTSGIAYVKSIVEGMELNERDGLKMNKFWLYFEKTWLPLIEFWNVRDEYNEYVEILARTNNGLERYNKRLNSLFNTNRTSLLNFIETLKKESIFQVDRLNNIRNGVNIQQDRFEQDYGYSDINVSLYVQWMIRQQDEEESNNSNQNGNI